MSNKNQAGDLMELKKQAGELMERLTKISDKLDRIEESTKRMDQKKARESVQTFTVYDGLDAITLTDKDWRYEEMYGQKVPPSYSRDGCPCNYGGRHQCVAHTTQAERDAEAAKDAQCTTCGLVATQLGQVREGLCTKCEEENEKKETRSEEEEQVRSYIIYDRLKSITITDRYWRYSNKYGQKVPESYERDGCPCELYVTGRLQCVAHTTQEERDAEHAEDVECGKCGFEAKEFGDVQSSLCFECSVEAKKEEEKELAKTKKTKEEGKKKRKRDEQKSEDDGKEEEETPKEKTKESRKTKRARTRADVESERSDYLKMVNVLSRAISDSSPSGDDLLESLFEKSGSCSQCFCHKSRCKCE